MSWKSIDERGGEIVKYVDDMVNNHLKKLDNVNFNVSDSDSDESSQSEEADPEGKASGDKRKREVKDLRN